MDPAPVLLLDSASLWFRAFHALPLSITAPDGRPVNAVRGFLDTLSRLLVDRRPRGLVACLDADWRPAFRVAALPSYKTHRLLAEQSVQESVPDDLAPQVPVILAVLEAAGLATAQLAGYEADDVIAVLAARLAPPVEVVSGDRDLFQLARPGVSVLYTVEKLRRYTDSDVAARFAIPAGTYADYAILRGDASDGLPGVAGIGDKTAAALLNRFGGLAAARAAAASGSDEGFPAGARNRLLAAEDYLDAAELVVRLRADLAVDDVAPELPSAPREPATLAALAQRHGLVSSVTRLTAALQTLTD